MAAAGNGRCISAANEAELVSALGSATGVEVSATVSEEKEPNDTWGRANPVAASGQVSGQIDAARDRDWYGLEVARSGRLAVKITNVPSALALQARVYDGNGRSISGYFKPLRAGAEVTGSAGVPAPGRYYVRISDIKGAAASGKPYVLKLTFHTSDTHEPNDSAGGATGVEHTAELGANILPQGDEDWYGFSVLRRGAIKVGLSQVALETDLQFRLYDGNARAVSGYVNPLRAGADNEATLDLPRAGRYYLRLKAYNDARNDEPYTLALTYRRGDPHEPNGDWATAARADPTDGIRGSILPKGDRDVYVFDAATGQYELSVTDVPAGMDIRCRVYNDVGRAVSGWYGPPREGAETRGKLELKTDGKYYIKVVDGGDDARSADKYELKLTPTVDK